MKKHILFTLILSTVYFYSYGQNDTINVAKNYQILLFFESPIIYSPIGNALDFVQVTGENGTKYSDRIIKLSQNIGSKGSGIYTNLTVITEDGNSYDFTLKTVKTPKQTSFKIKKSSASFNLEESKTNTITSEKKEIVELKVIESKEHQYSLKPNETKLKTTVTNTEKTTKNKKEDKRNIIDALYHTDRQEYFRLKCYYNQFDKGKIPRVFARNGDVFLWLKNVYYDKDHLFVQFKIENKQTIDFDVNFINYLIATNYRKSGSNQETILKPVFSYKQPEKIKGNRENHFVLVFAKFSLEKNMVFRVDIKEQNGARTLKLDVDKNLINNPQPF